MPLSVQVDEKPGDDWHAEIGSLAIRGLAEELSTLQPWDATFQRHVGPGTEECVACWKLRRDAGLDDPKPVSAVTGASDVTSSRVGPDASPPWSDDQGEISWEPEGLIVTAVVRADRDWTAALGEAVITFLRSVMADVNTGDLYSQPY